MIYTFICRVYGWVKHTKSPEFLNAPFLRNLILTIFRPRVTKSPDASKIENMLGATLLSYHEQSNNVFIIQKNQTIRYNSFLGYLFGKCKNRDFQPKIA